MLEHACLFFLLPITFYYVNHTPQSLRGMGVTLFYDCCKWCPGVCVDMFDFSWAYTYRELLRHMLTVYLTLKELST